MLSDLIDELPAAMQSRISALDERQQEAFAMDYEPKRRTMAMVYVMWLLGFHYAYFGNWKTQLLYLLTVWGLFVWLIVDFFRIKQMRTDYNAVVARKVLADMNA